MNRGIRLLRVCYWWGIIADAVMAVLMLFPGLFVRLMRIDLAPGPSFSYGLRMGAPLMIGWTILLLWADRKPVARRDILLLTLPVILGYVLIESYSLVAGLVSLAATIPLLAMQAGMMSLFAFAYARAAESVHEESA
jgi:hypothetical protein